MKSARRQINGRESDDGRLEPAWRHPFSCRLPDDQAWGSYWESRSDKGAYAAEAHDYVQRLADTIDLSSYPTVLDFGCGCGHVAQFLAPRVATLSLWDAAAQMRRFARARVAGIRNIRLVDLSDHAGMRRHEGEFDLILVHSVVQYLSLASIDLWLGQWRQLSAPRGRIILSDLVQPDASAVSELWSAARFAWRERALYPLVRDRLLHLPRYTSSARNRQLTAVTPDALTRMAARHGMTVTRLQQNLSFFAGRMACELTSPTRQQSRGGASRVTGAGTDDTGRQASVARSGS